MPLEKELPLPPLDPRPVDQKQDDVEAAPEKAMTNTVEQKEAAGKSS